mgnify:CR=1 FL=1
MKRKQLLKKNLQCLLTKLDHHRQNQKREDLLHLENKKPLLGICLGMQILGTHSEETPLGSDENDVIKCLSIVDGSVHKMKADNSLRMPHMGWNTVNHTVHPLFDGIKQNAYFYFDHSFAMNEGGFTTAGVTDDGHQLAFFYG